MDNITANVACSQDETNVHLLKGPAGCYTRVAPLALCKPAAKKCWIAVQRGLYAVGNGHDDPQQAQGHTTPAPVLARCCSAYSTCFYLVRVCSHRYINTIGLAVTPIDARQNIIEVHEVLPQQHCSRLLLTLALGAPRAVDIIAPRLTFAMYTLSLTADQLSNKPPNLFYSNFNSHRCPNNTLIPHENIYHNSVTIIIIRAYYTSHCWA